MEELPQLESGHRGRLEDVLFVGLCAAGLTALVLAFALPSGSLAAAELPAAPRSEQQRREVTEVAAAIDEAIRAEQLTAGVEPAPPADTLTVARRLSLALTGTIPSLEELRALEAQRSDRALAWWVDHLLGDRRFADYLAERLARPLVGVDQGAVILYRRRRFVAWLAERIAAGEAWDELARAMITGAGLWTQAPQTNFVTASIKPETAVPQEQELAGRVSRALLGVRLDCAQCHDHPFDDRWTQADFQGLAAFFGRAQVGLRGVEDVRGPYAYDDQASERRVTIEPAVPWASELLPAGAGGDRERLAAWVTAPENRPFSRAICNRVWALMLGRPLVEPVDDIPTAGPIPPALELLAEDFSAHGFDLRRLIRIVAATEAFARQSRSQPAAPDASLELRLATWAEFPLSRLRPEQVAGAVLQAASLTTADHESHVLARLARLSQTREFIARYGDAGEDELELDPGGGTIPQRLLLLNGDLVHERLEDDLVGNAATRIAALAPDDERAIEVAYLAVLTRRPTAPEREHFSNRLAGLDGAARKRALGDLYWALINSTEFSWQH